MSKRSRMSGWLLGLALALACSGGEKGPSGPGPSITIALNTTSLTIQQGRSGAVVATVSGAGGFSSSATISVEGAPAGVTGAVSSFATIGGVTTATVTVSVASSTVPGSYTITVRASGAGVAPTSVSLGLEVEPSPAVALTLASAALTVNQGAAGTLGVTLTRTNLAGAVTIEVTGAPAGVVGVTDPTPVAGNTATLMVTVPLSVATGVYNVLVRASASGATAVTVPLVLTVSPVPSLAITLGSATLAATTGSSTTTVVTLQRSGFSGSVALALEGAPAGVSGSFDPSPALASTAVLTIAIAGSAAPGVYPLVVRGTSSGVPTSTANLQLTITPLTGYSLSAAPVSIAIGGGGTSAISIVRTSFASEVALTLDSPPAGITGTFTPASTTGSSSVLSLNVAASVDIGTVQLTIRGMAAGEADRTTPLALTVTPVVGNYTLSTQPASNVAATVGGSIGLPVIIVPSGGFSGVPDVTVRGLPAGITAAVTSDPARGNLVKALTITVGSGVSPDPYSFTIVGSFPGLPEVTAEVTIAVNAANWSFTIDNAACGTGAPIWLATQNGPTAPWIRVLPSANGAWVTRLENARSGVAYVTTGFGGNRSTIVQYGSAAELRALTGDVLCFNPIQPSRTATVSAVGLTGSTIAFARFGGVSQVLNSLQLNRTFTGVQSGMHDLIAVMRQVSGFSGSDRVIIRRDLNPANGGSVGAALNFSSGEAFAPTAATMSIAGLRTGEVLNSVATNFHTGPSCLSAPLWALSYGTVVVLAPAYGVPVSKLRPTDFHSYTATATIGGSEFRSVTESSQALGDRTLLFGSPTPVPAFTRLPANFTRLQLDFVLPGDMNGGVSLNYGSGRTVFMSASPAWLAGAGGSMAVPDLSLISGFDDTWIVNGAPGSVSWFFTTSGSTGSPCSNAGRSIFANRMGTF